LKPPFRQCARNASGRNCKHHAPTLYKVVLPTDPAGLLTLQREEPGMFELETAETTGLTLCRACGAEQLDRDKFCRRCGVSQNRVVDQVVSIPRGISQSVSYDVMASADRSGCETGALSGSGTLRRSYSGPLVGLVSQKLSEETSSFRANRWVMLLISMMVAVPLWLIIVLLSPLDAYAAAKDLAKQV
jgi:ribosomal protein L40E